MYDVRNVRRPGCAMFGMCDVVDMGCSGWGMFETWDIRDVAYWFTKCCILKYDFLSRTVPSIFISIVPDL